MLMHLLFYHYFLKLLHEGEVGGGGKKLGFPPLKVQFPPCVCSVISMCCFICVYVCMLVCECVIWCGCFVSIQ